MRRTLCGVALCVALLVTPSRGARVKGERSYQPHEKIVLTADDVEKGSSILWDVDGEAQTEEKDNTLYVWAKPGRYRVTMTSINFDTKKVTRAKFTFVVQPEVPPPPPPPADPVTVPVVVAKTYAQAKTTLAAAGLTVSPPSAPDASVVTAQSPPAGSEVAKGSSVRLTLSGEPPAPPSPIPAAGFRVLIVYETGQVLPKDQAVILNSGVVRDYLRAKCAKDPDAEQDGKAYRIWDKDVDLANVNKTWADAMKRERKSVPWIIVSNHPKGGYEGPLPESVEKTVELLKKYAEDK